MAVKSMTIQDITGDSLMVSKAETVNLGAILEITSAEGNSAGSVWLTENQLWEVIEFLSR